MVLGSDVDIDTLYFHVFHFALVLAQGGARNGVKECLPVWVLGTGSTQSRGSNVRMPSCLGTGNWVDPVAGFECLPV